MKHIRRAFHKKQNPSVASSSKDQHHNHPQPHNIVTYPVREKKILVPGIFTADPAAHVVDGRIVVYCSLDNPATTNQPDDHGSHFDMKEYRILRLAPDLATVDDVGSVLPIQHVPWASSQLWAPDAVTLPSGTGTGAGSTYLYFPAKDRRGIFRIGVAISHDSPYGPFHPLPEPIPGSYSIDPCVFVDRNPGDGHRHHHHHHHHQQQQAYLYFGGDMGGQLHHWVKKNGNNKRSISTNTTATSGDGDDHANHSSRADSNASAGARKSKTASEWTYSRKAQRPTTGSALKARVARLAEDMTTFDGPVLEMVVLDESGVEVQANDLDRHFFEGSWVHKYNGLYYFSYSTGETHKIVYATSTSPIGPWTFRGTILSPPAGWTTHHSIVEYNSAWYLFYHDAARSGKDNLRNVKMQTLHYGQDGSIRPMEP